MIDSTAVTDFLRPGLTADGFALVENALSTNALPALDEIPAAFVHPISNRALSDNRLADFQHSQIVRQRFAVVIACPIADLRLRHDQVFARLAGVRLPGYDFTVQYEEGETLDLNRSLIWWRETYAINQDRRQ